MDNHASLTNDEKNAAEAAFSHRPFNPKWSAKARLVYDGIVKALPPQEEMDESATMTPTRETGSVSVAHAQTDSSPSEAQEPTDSMVTRIPLQKALDTGALIDVTPAARQLGFSFPVTVTKPLWDISIAPAGVSEDERTHRMRDVLMAFRLRLATQPTISPLMDFPALLTFPPGTVPQPVPLFALIQPDEQNRTMVTLLLPNEVSAAIIPMN